jgi:thioredoxin-dependent peroxiredoxin
MSAKLKPGDKAPDFELFDQNLNKFKLRDFINKKPIVLFFYPKDDTSLCTSEACSFRDYHKLFVEKGAEVIGISTDSIESHQSFSEKLSLPYRLLSDMGGYVKRLYGVSGILGIISGRETFIIDKEGIIKKIYSDPFHGSIHATEALEAIKSF